MTGDDPGRAMTPARPDMTDEPLKGSTVSLTQGLQATETPSPADPEMSRHESHSVKEIDVSSSRVSLGEGAGPRCHCGLVWPRAGRAQTPQPRRWGEDSRGWF